MNIHKILCFLNKHHWKYSLDQKFAKFDIVQRLRKCTACNKKQRAMQFGSKEIWLPPYPKPIPRNKVKK